MLGIKHHLLIGPLRGQLSISRVKMGKWLGYLRAKGLGWLLLLRILEVRRIKGSGSD